MTAQIVTGVGFLGTASGAEPPRVDDPMVEVGLHVHGKKSVNDLAAALSGLKDVNAVLASDAHAVDE